MQTSADSIVGYILLQRKRRWDCSARSRMAVSAYCVRYIVTRNKLIVSELFLLFLRLIEDSSFQLVEK